MTEAALPAATRGGALGRVFRNAGKLLGGKAAAGLIGLVYLSLGARTLGPTDFGLLVSINFYVMLVGNFCVLQGWHTLVRYGSGDLIEKHPEDFIALWRYVARIEIGSGLVAMLIALALCAPVGARLGWPEHLMPLALLYALGIVSSTQTTAAGILNLFGRFDLLSIQQISGPVVRMIGAGIAWALDAGLDGFLLAWLAGLILEGLVQWALGLRELHRRGLLRRPATATPTREVRERHPGILRFLLTNNLDIGLTDASGRITPLAVGALLNPAAVGFYHLALRIGMVLQQPVLVIGRTVYPELAAIAARGEFGRLRRLVLRTGGIAMAAGLVVLALFAVIGPWLLRTVGGGATVTQDFNLVSSLVSDKEAGTTIKLDQFVVSTEREGSAKAEITAEDSPLRHAPHTVYDLVEAWTHPYPKEEGCFPSGSAKMDKYWCPVGRIDNAYGDRNLVCSCPPIEAFA